MSLSQCKQNTGASAVTETVRHTKDHVVGERREKEGWRREECD